MSNSPTRGIRSQVQKNKRIEKTRTKNTKFTPRFIRDFPFFKAIKPKSKFLFRSDYFQIDQSFASILTIMHNTGSDDHLDYFWGIQLIPRNIGNDVSVRRIEHVSVVSESWVAQHQTKAEGLSNSQSAETGKGGSLTSKRKLNKRQQQLVEIAEDFMDGSSYLRVAIRLLVKAPTLERLDEAIEKINRQYKDRFDTVYAAPYVGEQKRELSNLYNKIQHKMGRNFMFTSSQFAGNYSLVTRGIEDDNGEYIGQMKGDVNNSAILMDIDRYESHVVIAGKAVAETESKYDFKGQKGVDVWGAKLGMCALLRNHRVVHLVLNRANISSIGVDLSDITATIDMTRGDINPLELFGQEDQELSIFPAHLDKIFLMLDQLQHIPEINRSRIKGALLETLNNFYVDKRMWAKDAQNRRSMLRLVGIDHKDVPQLPEFLAYLDAAYKKQVNAKNKDDNVMDAYGFLATAFRDMLDSNGDLFNTITSEVIDHAAVSSRVIYDFSSLIKRNRGVMMAQFINALGFSVGTLGEGDVVLFHGVEQLAPNIKSYVRDRIDELHSNGVRTVFIYNSVDAMIEDHKFNGYDSADYTLLGGMTKSTIQSYEQTLKQEVPLMLRSLLEHKDRSTYYLRRGFDNLVFASDIQVGLISSTSS